MEKAFLTPVILTKKQETLCIRHAIASRILFNTALGEHRNRYFRKKAKAFFVGKNVKEIKVKYKDPTYTDYKDKFPWMNKLSAVIRRDAVINANEAMKNFFRRYKNGEKSGFPRFKNKKSPLKFVTYQGDSFKLHSQNNNQYATHIKLNNNFGWIKLVRQNYIPMNCKNIQAAFSHRVGKWYVSISMHIKERELPPLKNIEFGVDVGSRTLAAVSNGNKYNPSQAVQFSLEKTEKQLKRWQKIMSRRFKRGSKEQSKGWLEAKNKVQKLYDKLSNTRKDVVDKISHTIVDHKPKRIVIEHLNVQGMKSNKRLAPTLQKIGMYKLQQCIVYKSRWRGIKVQQVDRWYPSSQLCSCCGNRKSKKELGSREIYICLNAGCANFNIPINRDINAAINLQNAPQNKLKDLT